MSGWSGDEPVERTKEYYIASAECREVKSFKGTVMVANGAIIWLGYSDGYPSCETAKGSAHKFKTTEEIRAQSEHWDGMPWYYALKPGTLRIYHIKERIIQKRIETVIS